MINNSEMESITPEDIGKAKSRTILYLQYLSILFSILFSITGIYWFLFASEEKTPEVIEKTIVEKNTTIIQEKPVNYIIDGLEMWSFIWHKDTKRGVTFKEGNDYCANLEPKGIWRIPSFAEIFETRSEIQERRADIYDKNTGIDAIDIIYSKDFENKILTESWWYIGYMWDATVPFYYNEKINTTRNANPLETKLAWEDVIVKCITERYKIYPNDYGRFPWCDSDNIRLSNGQIWAACNLWAKKAWDWVSMLKKCDPTTYDCNQDKEWRWRYYQFWRTGWWPFISAIDNSTRYGRFFEFYRPSNEKHTWENLQKSGSSLCPAWWHIPTIEEWRKAYAVTWNTIWDLRKKLLLPAAWFREGQHGNFVSHLWWITWKTEWWKSYSPEYPISYWSSDSSYINEGNVKEGSVILVNFYYPEISSATPVQIYNPWYEGYSIRCLANL